MRRNSNATIRSLTIVRLTPSIAPAAGAIQCSSELARPVGPAQSPAIQPRSAISEVACEKAGGSANTPRSNRFRRSILGSLLAHAVPVLEKSVTIELGQAAPFAEKRVRALAAQGA